jgi:hypothetical protein
VVVVAVVKELVVALLVDLAVVDLVVVDNNLELLEHQGKVTLAEQVIMVAQEHTDRVAVAVERLQQAHLVVLVIHQAVVMVVQEQL